MNELGQPSVAVVHAAGDLCRTPAMPVPGAQVVMAAQGARAVVVIDQDATQRTSRKSKQCLRTPSMPRRRRPRAQILAPAEATLRMLLQRTYSVLAGTHRLVLQSRALAALPVEGLA